MRRRVYEVDENDSLFFKLTHVYPGTLFYGGDRPAHAWCACPHCIIEKKDEVLLLFFFYLIIL